MQPLVKLLVAVFGVVVFCKDVNALRCHDCVCSDYVPSAVLKVLVKLNLTTANQKGDCKSQETFCENGQFCMKNAVTYRISFNGMKYNWNTFTKGCASPENVLSTTEFSNSSGVENKPMSSGTCYTSTNNTGSTTVTTVNSLCYCDDKDFCNTGSILSTSISVLSACLMIAAAFCW
uniref:UPAR/Ly6 domain-containing protein n=1 Tax=Steinernema glaseri TaxID=37863 RepID=A0A1I7ZGB1_9BILA